jgi:hypothetical protein
MQTHEECNALSASARGKCHLCYGSCKNITWKRLSIAAVAANALMQEEPQNQGLISADFETFFLFREPDTSPVKF